MNETSKKSAQSSWVSHGAVIVSFAVLGWFTSAWFLRESTDSPLWRVVVIECFVIAGLLLWNFYSLALSFALRREFFGIKKADSWTYLIFLLLLFYPRLSGVAELFPPGRFKFVFFITILLFLLFLKLLQLFYWLWGTLIATAIVVSLILGISVTELKIAPQNIFDAFRLDVIVASQFAAVAFACICFLIFRRRAKKIILSLITFSFSAAGWYYATLPYQLTALPSREDIESLPSAGYTGLFSNSPKIRNIRITVNEETRDAIYFFVPATVSERVDVSMGAHLSFGAGVPYFSEGASGKGAKITLLANGETLCFTSLDPVHYRGDRMWKDFDVDLSAFGGSTVELALHVEGAPHVAISVPQIFYGEHKSDFPNIVLILIDTLRADRVGFAGYPQEITPNLDAMAKRGVIFERAISTAPWTEPATAAIFTGMLPSQTGVGFPNVTLPSSAKTLAEYLQEIGYSTAGFSGNPLISAKFNFDKGFALFNERCVDHFQWRSAECLTDEAIGWFKKSRRRPFFLYVHYIDPHARYDAPPPYHDRFSYGYTGDNESVKRGDIIPFEMRIKRGQKVELSQRDADYLEKLYLGEVAYVDDQIGKLVESLMEDSESPTIFIITSDHGEEFMEHGIVGHIYNLHDTLLHVPLIFFGYGIKDKMRIKTTVSTADIMPTILDMLGLSLPQNSWGVSLKPLLAGGNIEERGIFAEGADFWRNSYALVTSEWKLIYSPQKEKMMLFDIVNDSGEYHDISGKKTDVEKKLIDELKKILDWASRHKLPPAPPDRERRREHKKRLQALGYIGN